MQNLRAVRKDDSVNASSGIFGSKYTNTNTAFQKKRVQVPQTLLDVLKEIMSFDKTKT